MISRRAGVYLLSGLALRRSLRAKHERTFWSKTSALTYRERRDCVPLILLCTSPVEAIRSVTRRSGHTLKHLAAGAAGFRVLRRLEKRRPIENHFAR